MDITYDYEFINTYEGTRTPTGKVICDKSTAYFTRALYQRLMSTIKFNLPSYWNKRYFKNVLYKNGFIGIINDPKYGVIPQKCTLSGYGLWMQPTNILVKETLVNFDGEIGKDCELIMLTPDYMGVHDIVDHYAVQLSTCFTSIKMSLENSRLAFILAGKTKSAKETLKAIAEKISSGESVIVVDKLLKEDIESAGKGDSIFTQTFDVKNSYITDKLLNDLQTILNMFDREIGIKVVDEKKERMLTSEISTQTSDSNARINTWLECLKESIDRVNTLFPDLNITFERNTEEVKKDESNAQNDANRDV